MDKKRIIIGISGASGAPIAVELLKIFKTISEVESHLIYTNGSKKTILQETGYSLEDIEELADVIYDNNNIGASLASGSFKTEGMIIVPCSMKTVAGIATGYSDNLLLRAADVVIKEKRKLVLVTRECPLSQIHLRNMLELANMGAYILPPVLSYYNHPVTIQDATNHIVGKIMDSFGMEYDKFQRWNG
ncbi:MAG: UbiX family flavin prenyltransferase [Anaerolineaceae bacterium]|nr:MAG: UbiX family flavin prenyltransferase [Anaerolineaceae bacterium]